MKLIQLLFLLFGLLIFGQKNKKGLDVVSNIEAKVIAMKPIGNNSLSKDLQPFYGFAFGGNLMTPINFGIGADFSMLFSNVVFGRENLYGNIGSPKLTIIDIFLTHRENVSEDFKIEEMAGFSYYSQSNLYIDQGQTKNKNSGIGFNVGGKALYILDPEGYQAVFVAGKVNYYLNNVYNENPDIQNYYDRSTFLSLSLGYRFNF